MYKELDDKLRDIFTQHRMNVQEWDEETLDLECIKLIKQAFADEGYVDATINNTDDPLYLTGQEWYDRFQNELNKLMLKTSPTQVMDDPVQIIEAAKKAANL